MVGFKTSSILVDLTRNDPVGLTKCSGTEDKSFAGKSENYSTGE